MRSKPLDVFECRCPARQPASGGADGVTLLDCQACEWRPRPVAPEVRAVVLRHHLSPGDVVVLTGAVRSLHLAHPGQFAVNVDTSFAAAWEHSPDVAGPEEMARHAPAETVEVHYPAINRCGREPIHMLAAYCEHLSEQLGVPVPPRTNRPHLWLSRREREWLNQAEEAGHRGKFWLLNAGVKQDYTAKQYPFYQEVVDLLRGRVTFVQVGRGEHLHRPLRGVIDMVGKTDDRQLIRLAYHAQGVLCGVTCLMHLAAGLEKPAVVVAGGREPRSWNTYPRQTLLSNVGCLPCAASEGCWRSRVVKRSDGAEQDASLCEAPCPTDPPAGKCMALISPRAVADAVLAYYEGGVLSF